MAEPRNLSVSKQVVSASKWKYCGPILKWLAVAFSVYTLISAVSIIGSGVMVATNGHVTELFEFASNPLAGLAVGILATVLTQSSSTTTSVVVGMVAGGLPIETAIPILIGANLGTTMTSTLVAFGVSEDRSQFRKAFSAASIHDTYNLLSVALLFPLEMMFGFLEKVSQWIANVTTGSDGGIVTSVFTGIGTAISSAISPLTNLVKDIAVPLGETGGVLMILGGIFAILFSIKVISKLLKTLLVGQAERVFHHTVGRNPISGVFAGLAITMMVQSSSTTTSLTVPLAASGKFDLKQVYPFTVGANVGTTMTALIAALGFSGPAASAAMTAASVHLVYNVISALVIFGIPFLRVIPLRGAQLLGELGAHRRLWAVLWTLGVFIVLPGSILLITALAA